MLIEVRTKTGITEINALPRWDFVQRLGWIFEDSPWVAERAWNSRPFLSIEHLHAAMVQQVQNASSMEQLELLRAHPDLGAHAGMSGASVSEQGQAGLDRLTKDDYNTLALLNRAYREKFGFPFLFAVKGSDKDVVIRELRRRLLSTPDAELKEALLQVYRIASFRLQDLVLEEGRE